MEKEQKLYFIAFAILLIIIGFALGTVFNEYIVDNSGIEVTSYCKEIQIDTLLYDYSQNLYKYKIKIIK